jgi:type VI secretion system secreted protein VgrG
MAAKPRERALGLTTPLGTDVLFLTGFTGREAISSPFHFDLDIVGPPDVQFADVVGANMTITIGGGRTESRTFNGFVSRFSAGSRGLYRAELVPQLWLLTRTTRSRTFQQMSVPDVLRKVLTGLGVEFQLTGQYPARDYCVQYRESDFDFASRLMEEEGIFYFFRHGDDGHTMVVADSPASHPSLGTVPFDATGKTPGAVLDWEKTQELRSGKATLRDHHFELPAATLEFQQGIQPTALVGEVEHRLALPANQGLEIYDYPGGYAKRFDGIGPGGGDQPAELTKIFPAGERAAALAAQLEAAASIEINGSSLRRNLVTGSSMDLERSEDRFNGRYLITGVTHRAHVVGDPSTATPKDLDYANTFTCIPASIPYRPPRVTPKARVEGPQTAVVVGPAGEQVFTDKYARVKVQFFWDREGKKDEKSSCWIRVAAPHAGSSPGGFILPEVGDEVVVAFLEGDPDQPIIVGSVWNAEKPPPPRPNQ